MSQATMKEQLKLIQSTTDSQFHQLAEWRKAIKGLEVEYGASETDAAVLRAQLDRLRGWADAFPGQRDTWDALEADVKARYDQLALRFEGQLRERCQTAGYRVTGRSPELRVESLIKVQTDTSRNEARINNKRVAPMALARVFDAIAAEVKRLWERPFDGNEFLARLRAAYQSAAGDKDGPVPAKAVYTALAAADKAYQFDMFAADLSQLVASGALNTAAGAPLILAPSRDTRQAVWVPDQTRSDGRYIGLIEFKSRADEGGS